MKSELSWLIDLLLDEELTPPLKKHVTNRIREVEKGLMGASPAPKPMRIEPRQIPSAGAQQAPSMQRIIEANPDIAPPVPTTSAAANALSARQALIQRSIATDKPEPGRTSPRKF